MTGTTSQVITHVDPRKLDSAGRSARPSREPGGVSAVSLPGTASMVRLCLRVAGWALLLAAVVGWIVLALHDAPA